MFIKKQKKLNYEPLIEEVIKKLKNGENRFAISNYHLYDCIKDFPSLTSNDDFLFEIPHANKDISNDYNEEMDLLKNLIEKTMIDADVPITHAEKKNITKNVTEKDPYEKMEKILIINSLAEKLWRQYAIPWRYKNGTIYVITQYRDSYGITSMGTKEYPVDFFLREVAIILAKRAENEVKARKWREFWYFFAAATIPPLLYFVGQPNNLIPFIKYVALLLLFFLIAVFFVKGKDYNI